MWTARCRPTSRPACSACATGAATRTPGCPRAVRARRRLPSCRVPLPRKLLAVAARCAHPCAFPHPPAPRVPFLPPLVYRFKQTTRSSMRTSTCCATRSGTPGGYRSTASRYCGRQPCAGRSACSRRLARSHRRCCTVFFFIASACARLPSERCPARRPACILPRPSAGTRGSTRRACGEPSTPRHGLKSAGVCRRMRGPVARASGHVGGLRGWGFHVLGSVVTSAPSPRCAHTRTSIPSSAGHLQECERPRHAPGAARVLQARAVQGCGELWGRSAPRHALGAALEGRTARSSPRPISPTYHPPPPPPCCPAGSSAACTRASRRTWSTTT